MGFREDIRIWVLEAIQAEGGEAEIVQVAKHIWLHHESELKSAGDHFYSWQYDMRWGAQSLRDAGRIGKRKFGAKSIWFIK